MKGDRKRAKELRMYQAYLRQVDYRALQHQLGGKAAVDPAEMLSRAARTELAAGTLDVESWRGAS